MMLHCMSQNLAAIVAKVEHRATRKFSRKLIFGLLRRCVAFQRHYRDPWSILDETIWSLTSPLVKRISGSKKFRSSPQKDFCNNICHSRNFDRSSALRTPPHEALQSSALRLIVRLGRSPSK